MKNNLSRDFESEFGGTAGLTSVPLCNIKSRRQARTSDLSARILSTACASAPGAISIVNAWSNGLGAAIAINLRVKAAVSLFEDEESKIEIITDYRSVRGTNYLKRIARRMLDFYPHEKQSGMLIRIDSALPIGRGLKSSAAVGVAAAMAIKRVLRLKLRAHHIVQVVTQAAFSSGLTTAGSLDDTWTSLVGGACFTNIETVSLVSRKLVERLQVILLLPLESDRRVKPGSRDSLKFHRHDVRQLWYRACKGEVFPTMTANGLIHACHFGYDTSPISQAMRAGALAATLSGKGPAFAAVCDRSKTASIATQWGIYGWPLCITNLSNVGAQ